MPLHSSLLAPPPFPADGYAALADRLARLLGTASDVLLLQGEAVLALEAIATSLARPGLRALNVVTSPYGQNFGAWLRRGGASVTDVVAPPGQPITVDAVRRALDAAPAVDVLAVVHGEAANGALNPLTAIAALAKARGALLVVDAVASFGAHALPVDELGLDIVAFGPQKALAGPAGVSAVAVSASAWSVLAAAPRTAPSLLSLLDLKDNWLDRGRGALPGTPSTIEFLALAAALDRVEAIGLPTLIDHHTRAARATRAGLRALGVPLWIDDDDAASALITSLRLPAGVTDTALIASAATFGAPLAPGHGEVAGRLVRLDHTGLRAACPAVLANVVGLGAALQQLGVAVDVGAAAEAIVRSYGARA